MKDTQDNGGSRHVISFHDCGQDIIHLATNYASDYLDYVENLPFDLQRSVTKFREVDQKCQEHVKEMEQLYENFKKELEGTQGIPRRSYLLQIRRLFGICKELGDEKISIVQSISEAIESRNKQLEHGCRRFKYAYEPNIKMDHSKKEKDSKSDSARGSKRSRRQRNNNSSETKDKTQSSNAKDGEKPGRASYDDADEPPAKVMLPSASSDHSSPASSSAPALTRAALREEDKRLKDKKDEKQAKDADHNLSVANSGKNSHDAVTTVSSSTSTTPSSTGSVSTSKAKSSSTMSVASSSATTKANTKGKKKKRKSNKIEKQASASGEASPIIDMPIDPDEPTYCICQQVSFGQMIGCDNLKCPIEWFHFSCVRLTHKPKGKWYCPDCTLKRKRDGKKSDNR